MAQISTNEFKTGFKVEVDGEPYTIVSNEFVKPGKGQPFNRVKLKHLKSGRVIERTFKSGEKIDVVDVEDHKLLMIYQDADSVVFMDDKSFEQTHIPLSLLEGKEQWLLEETLFDIVFYKGEPIDVNPPTFMEMKIVETT